MEEDPYYQHRIRFRAGNELLNLKLHRSEETRTDDWLLQPLRRRVRTSYIHARPYLLAHQPVLTVALYSRPAPGGAIGEVVGSDYGEFLEQEVGNAQAWIFPVDKVLLLWECYLFRDFRTAERQLALCRTFEGWLLEQAPVEEVYTPGWDPDFPEDAFKDMLDTLSYEPVEGTRFRKKVIKGQT